MKILIFGLGAIGSNVLDQLSKKYGSTMQFVGVDCDLVEERNLKTQVYFIETVGVAKATAVIPILQRKSRDSKYTPIRMRITILEEALKIIKDIKFDLDSDLILDCFDNTISRKLIHELPATNTLHIGFSPQYSAEIIWKEQYSVPQDVDPSRSDICELTEAVPFIGLVTSFSTMVISEFIDRKVKENYIIMHKYIIKKL